MFNLSNLMNYYANTWGSDMLATVKNAQHHISWGDYREAIEAYKKVIKMIKSQMGTYASDLKPIYAEMASVYDKMGDPAEAIKYYKKILNLESMVMGGKPLDTAAIYNHIGSFYYKDQEPKKAIANYKKSLEITVRELGYRDQRVAEIMDSLAKAYHDAKDYKKAAEYYSQYYPTMMGVLESNPPEKIRYSIRLGNYYYQAQAYEDALGSYGVAKNDYERYKQDDLQQLCHIHYLLGNAHYRLGNLRQAEKDYQESLSLQKEEDSQTMDIYINRGNLLRETEKYEEACSLYEKALAIHESIANKDPKQVASIYLALGYLWDDQLRFDKAINYHKKALNTLKEMPEPDQEQLMNTYYSMSKTYNLLQENLHALEYYQKAIELQKLFVAPDDKIFIKIYYNLAVLYHNHQNDKEACRAAMQSLYIANLKNSSDHELLATVYEFLGDIYWQTISLDKSLSRKDLILTPFTHNQNTIQYLQPNYNLEEREQAYLALDCYRDAIEQLELNDDYYYQFDNIPLLKVNFKIAQGYALLSNYPQALKYYKDIALCFKRDYIPEEEGLLTLVHNGLGKIFFQQGDYKKATTHYKEALAIVKNQEKSKEIVQTLTLMLTSSMAMNYYHMEKYKQAIKCLEEATRISKKLKLDDYSAINYNNWGVVEYDNQNYQEATKLLAKSLAIKLRKNVNSSPLSLLATYHNLGIVSQELGAASKAADYHQKAYQIAQENLEQEDPIMQHLVAPTPSTTIM